MRHPGHIWVAPSRPHLCGTRFSIFSIFRAKFVWCQIFNHQMCRVPNLSYCPNCATLLQGQLKDVILSQQQCYSRWGEPVALPESYHYLRPCPPRTECIRHCAELMWGQVIMRQRYHYLLSHPSFPKCSCINLDKNHHKPLMYCGRPCPVS